MRPLIHKGSSANVNYYGEPGPERHGRIWCEVLCSAFTFGGVDGPTVKPVPDYHFTIYASGVGKVGAFTYSPKRRPRPEKLADRTVTRLVRVEMEA